MKDQLQIIREAMRKMPSAETFLAIEKALAQIEAAAGEQEPCGWYDDGRVFLHEGKLPPNGADLYAAPVAQQPQAECRYPDCECPTESPCLRGLPIQQPQAEAEVKRSAYAKLSAAVETATAKQAEAVPSDVVRDAERYRWLREGCNDKGAAATQIARDMYGMEWDAAIDAAMAQGAKT